MFCLPNLNLFLKELNSNSISFAILYIIKIINFEALQVEHFKLGDPNDYYYKVETFDF